MKREFSRIILTVMGTFVVAVSFQNCAPPVEFSSLSPEKPQSIVELPEDTEFESQVMEIASGADYSETGSLIVYATIGSVTLPDMSSEGDGAYVANVGFFDIVHK